MSDPLTEDGRAIAAKWAAECVAGNCPFASADDRLHAETILRYEAYIAANLPHASLGAALRAALQSLPPHQYASLEIFHPGDDAGVWVACGDEPGRHIHNDATRALQVLLSASASSPAEIPSLSGALHTAQREAYRQHIRGCLTCEGGGAVHLCTVGETLHAALRGDIPPLTEDVDDPRSSLLSALPVVEDAADHREEER